FTLTLTDPPHRLPKCCSDLHVPLKHVNKLVSYQTSHPLLLITSMPRGGLW
ncbi:hypothetical protein L873DRAFT_1725442, partial [Choiromyces venosus 120613-1]